MSGVIDANILLYAANADAGEHPAAVSFLAEAAQSADQWYVTEGVYYEFLRVSTHARVFAAPLSWKEALAFLEPFFESARFATLTAGPTHWMVLGRVVEELTHPAGNLFFDIRTATLMREHGVRQIYTTDTDFLQFGDIEVINPLRA